MREPIGLNRFAGSVMPDGVSDEATSFHGVLLLLLGAARTALAGMCAAKETLITFTAFPQGPPKNH